MVSPSEPGAGSVRGKYGSPPSPSRARIDGVETESSAYAAWKGRRHLFWKPVSCRTLLKSGSIPELAPDDVDGHWMRSAADAIERTMAMLPAVDEFEERECLTAAIYVEAARSSLRVAYDALRLASSRSTRYDVEDLHAVDPLLAEWLH